MSAADDSGDAAPWEFYHGGLVLAYGGGYVADCSHVRTAPTRGARCVSVDHLIDREGGVRVRVNGTLLPDLP